MNTMSRIAGCRLTLMSGWCLSRDSRNLRGLSSERLPHAPSRRHRALRAVIALRHRFQFAQSMDCPPLDSDPRPRICFAPAPVIGWLSWVTRMERLSHCSRAQHSLLAEGLVAQCLWCHRRRRSCHRSGLIPKVCQHNSKSALDCRRGKGIRSRRCSEGAHHLPTAFFFGCLCLAKGCLRSDRTRSFYRKAQLAPQ